MTSAAAIRLQIETALAHRIPSALTPRPRIVRRVAPTGVAALDELLEGGLPLGAISEMTGPECSGRSAVALSFVSLLTRAGSVCAWIDVSDSFDPESATAARVDLSRLLWVRCAVSAERPQPAAEYKFALPEKYLIPAATKHGLHGGGCGGQASVLLLTQHPCAKSSGELLLRFQPGVARQDEATVFTGIGHCVEIERQRFAAQTNVVSLRKPPQRVSAAHWRSQTTWAGAR